jgi:hypothetical protein
MSQYPVLPLVSARQAEALKSWEEIKTPQDLINYCKRMLGVDPNQLLQFQEIESSPLEPQPGAEDRKQIWIKTDGAPAIGILIGSSYKLIYEYPPNVPLIWTKSVADFPGYLTKLTPTQVTNYGLAALTPPTDAFYFMLVV